VIRLHVAVVDHLPAPAGLGDEAGARVTGLGHQAPSSRPGVRFTDWEDRNSNGSTPQSNPYEQNRSRGRGEVALAYVDSAPRPHFSGRAMT
jgi:hypothetical protein